MKAQAIFNRVSLENVSRKKGLLTLTIVSCFGVVSREPIEFLYGQETQYYWPTCKTVDLTRKPDKLNKPS